MLSSFSASLSNPSTSASKSSAIFLLSLFIQIEGQLHQKLQLFLQRHSRTAAEAFSEHLNQFLTPCFSFQFRCLDPLADQQHLCAFTFWHLVPQINGTQSLVAHPEAYLAGSCGPRFRNHRSAARPVIHPA